MPAYLRMLLVSSLLALSLFPTVLGRYSLLFLNWFMVLVVLALSFNIMYGFAGYLNLGHAAFYGMGGYLFGIAYSTGLGPPASFLLAGIAAMLLALCVSLPLFRLRGGYFAIATLGLNVLFFTVVYNLEGITGGYQGLFLRTGDSLISSYYVLLALLSAALSTNYLIIKSRLGLTLRAIRDDEEAASTLGIKVLRAKIYALVLSTLFPSLAGASFAWYNAYITPETGFGTLVVFLPIVMTLVGGSGTLLGPVIGAVFLVLITEFLTISAPTLTYVVLGLLIILVGAKFPRGIISAILPHDARRA